MTSMHELQTGLWYRQAAHPDWNAATAGGWGPEVTSYEMLVRLRPLLELPSQLVLPTHGAPTDRSALELALS